jgi:hypothetical protein
MVSTQFQKPHALESPKYEKPNAYDEEPAIVTASRHGSRSSRTTIDSFSSRYYKYYQREPTPVSMEYIDIQSPVEAQSPHEHIDTPVTSEKRELYSPLLRVLTPSSPTTEVSLGQDLEMGNDSDILIAYDAEEAGNGVAFTPPKTRPKCRRQTWHVYHFFRQPKSTHHDIFVSGSRLYQKQDASSWGMNQTLHRCDGVKVASAYRRAFQKVITIESADYGTSAENLHTHELTKISQSNVLFEYDTIYRDALIRWQKLSLLSMDFICEIKLTKRKPVFRKNSKNKRMRQDGFIDSDSDNDEDDHDHHSHRTCRRWKLLAEFDGDEAGLGQLAIDPTILHAVERPDLLEVNLLITCSILIDLTHKAIGKKQCNK